MALQEKSRYYEIPIVSKKIKKLIYDGLLQIVFNDQDESYLDLHGEFEVVQHNQKSVLSPSSKEALLRLYDLFDVQIKEAKADKHGRLFLFFEDAIELTIEDSRYENWHFTRIDRINPKNSLHIHGGVGKTAY